MEEIKYFVITGGPGVGKTTLINALEERGYLIVPEEARKIIKEQMQIKGEGLPWKNKALYADLMFEASLKTYQKVVHETYDKTIFFDRGILDTICYRNMEYMPVSEELDQLVNAHPYNRKVFILPTWEEAVDTFGRIKHTYLEYGYEVIEVPKVSIEKRCDFILSLIATT